MIVAVLIVLPVLVTTLASPSASVALPNDVTLIEFWDCGPEANPILGKIAKASLNQCPSLQVDANLCCKAHDFCYATHKENNFTHEHCDFKFCGCLQDARDLYEHPNCDPQLNIACTAVKKAGGSIFSSSNPKNATELEAKYGKVFEDARPLGLDMKSLVDVCDNAKGMVIHCHNAAYHCFELRARKFSITTATAYWEDCASIMFECLQTISESGANPPCTSQARGLIEQLLSAFEPLSEERVGKSTIEVYPVVSARLLQACVNNTSDLETCMLAFDSCAQHPKMRESIPHQFNAARRINITCHQFLRECVSEVVIPGEGREVPYADWGKEVVMSPQLEQESKCFEAKYLAIDRIRKIPYENPKLGSAVKTLAGKFVKGMKELRSKVKDKVKIAKWFMGLV